MGQLNFKSCIYAGMNHTWGWVHQVRIWEEASNCIWIAEGTFSWMVVNLATPSFTFCCMLSFTLIMCVTSCWNGGIIVSAWDSFPLALCQLGRHYMNPCLLISHKPLKSEWNFCSSYSTSFTWNNTIQKK